MVSGLILFFYIGVHLLNHALGLISLNAAEAGMNIAIEVWYSVPGTILLYGAAGLHFLMALWAVYERRTFFLPPAELIRIALGFTLPIVLIGHAASTRLAYELIGFPSDYTHVVAVLWAAGSQGWQLGLMAPGWLHGCLGLHFAFSRRPTFRQLRLVLFAIALLLPVLAGLGFIAMGKEIAANQELMAEAMRFLSPENAAERLKIAQWKDGLLNGYFAIIGAAFVAREIRNLFERRRNRLIAITYPGRTVRVPVGWSVLEASRGFHLPHASMCGGRARCSTCRVRVTAGDGDCPEPAADEQATLERIGAESDVRLACQWRPQGNVSVVPLVRTARPIYRPAAPRHSGERDIAVLYCDFRNRSDLAVNRLPQDLLYILTLYVEGIGNAIRAHGGSLSYVETDSLCALFGVDGGSVRASQRALQAAGAIGGVIADLNNRLGPQGENLKVTVSIHAGRGAISEIGSGDGGVILAVGEVIDAANEMRKVAAARDRGFAVSVRVYGDAGLEPADAEKVMLRLPGFDEPVAAMLSDSAPVPSPHWTAHGAQSRRTTLRRLWSG
jgi:adenylate cyclase